MADDSDSLHVCQIFNDKPHHTSWILFLDFLKIKFDLGTLHASDVIVVFCNDRSWPVYFSRFYVPTSISFTNFKRNFNVKSLSNVQGEFFELLSSDMDLIHDRLRAHRDGLPMVYIELPVLESAVFRLELEMVA